MVLSAHYKRVLVTSMHSKLELYNSQCQRDNLIFPVDALLQRNKTTKMLTSICSYREIGRY